MTDYNNLFIGLINSVKKSKKTKKEQEMSLLRSTISNNPFNKFSNQVEDTKFNFGNKINGVDVEFNEFNVWAENKPTFLHIYMWNILDNIKSNSINYLAMIETYATNETIKKYISTETIKVEEKNKKNKKEDDINKRLSQYYNSQTTSYNGYSYWAKIIFYIFLCIIFLIFLIKKQHKNLKVLFFILMLFLITYSIEPIFNLVSDYIIGYSREVHIYSFFYILLILFGLFISFGRSVFSAPTMEGSIDYNILKGIVFFGFSCIFFRYMYYDKGFKSIF